MAAPTLPESGVPVPATTPETGVAVAVGAGDVVGRHDVAGGGSNGVFRERVRIVAGRRRVVDEDEGERRGRRVAVRVGEHQRDRLIDRAAGMIGRRGQREGVADGAGAAVVAVDDQRAVRGCDADRSGPGGRELRQRDRRAANRERGDAVVRVDGERAGRVASLVPEGVEPDARSDSSTLPSVPPPLSLRPVIDGASGTASTVSVSVPVSVVVPSLTV